MKRLIDVTVVSGWTSRERLASQPTIGSPDVGMQTTEGVSRRPCPSAKTRGIPESTTATSELVVPRSMPIIFATRQNLPR